ncbi:MAG TPA: adenylate/guanylate cyclase domain-containing protein, partial [Ignavibacteria bacterium]|nr:adenylate/guanylate cyclase domain-containing protein [Ignavibacteria bacterium]
MKQIIFNQMIKPTGNVTFLFTDIEGSTKLAQEFVEHYPAALIKHNIILNETVKSNNGFVFKTVGDAFCCAFQNSHDAVNAACEIQMLLLRYDWKEVKIKIRIGIHSGKAEWNGKDYMGYITLARVSRVMSAANGEQIIISNDALELCDTNNLFSDKIFFRDLGERRLKDVIQPINLFQINSPGLREDFPPLKTLDARPNNLPAQLTNFIGKEEEVKAIKEILKESRLVTLLGTGGAGKSRLTIQIAADLIDDFANGVWFIELAPLSNPDYLAQTIASVFNLQSSPDLEITDVLINYLNEKEILLIFDNCEHLTEACSVLAEKLLVNSPGLKILASSREVLRSGGEKIHHVLPLKHPAINEEVTPLQLSQFEAVRLFIERAIAVKPDFRVNNDNVSALAQICYRLDGIPLAIELAAARIKILTVNEINNRLENRFNLLTGGKRTDAPRQQTFRALIDWSYDLLS